MAVQLFTSLRYDPALSESRANTALANGVSCRIYMLQHHRDRLLEAAQHFAFPDAVRAVAGAAGLAVLRTIVEDAVGAATTPHRVKVVLSPDGSLAVQAGPTPSVPLANLYPESLPPPVCDNDLRGRNDELDAKAQPAYFVSPKIGNALTGDDGANVRSDHLSTKIQTLPGLESVSGTGRPQLEANCAAVVRHGSDPGVWTVVVDPERTDPSSYTKYKTLRREMYDAARARAGLRSMADPKEVLLISRAGEVMEGSLTSVFLWRNGRWVTPPPSSGGQLGTTRRWLLQAGQCEEAVVLAHDLIDGEACWLANGVRGFMPARIQLSAV